MKTLLPMNGSINRDANPLYIASDRGDVYDRRNCRVYSFDGNRTGINVSIKGMTEVSASLPSGTNVIIGYVQDKERDCGIFFNYNSNGNDGIYIFTGSLVINLGVPNGVLGFSPFYFVRASVIGDYCVFTDNLNPPRKIQFVNDDGDFQINLLSGKSADDIQLANENPYNAPTVKLGSDTTKKINKLVGHSFQFAHFYVYKDNTYSVLSPYSELVVSTAVFSAENNTYEDNSTGNYVNVTFDVGSDEVSSVKLVARDGNSGNWFLVTEYEKESTDAEYAERTHSFYNDVAKQSIVENVTPLNSDVPLLAKDVSIVKNRVGLANVVKGYDKDITFNYEVSVEYEAVDVSGGDPVSLAVTESYAADTFSINLAIPDESTINTNDVFSVSIAGRYVAINGGSPVWDFNFSYSASYQITEADKATGNADDILADFFMYDIIAKGKSIITSMTEGSLFDLSVSGSQPVSGGVNIDFIGVYDAAYVANAYYGSTYTQDSVPQGVSTFKAGSWYNVSPVLYDKRSRTAGVFNSKKIYIPSNGERAYADAYKRARLKIDVLGYTIPEWAEYLRFAVTESVNFAGVYPFVTGAATVGIYDTYLDNKAVFAINLPTNFQYEFNKGDYLQIEVDNGSDTITTITKTIIGTRSTIEYVGENKTGFWLVVPKGDETIDTYIGNLAYVYRTKDTVSNLVYYEDFNTYDVDDIPASLYVDCGDAWFVSRKYEWSGVTPVTQTVEDFYINVDDAIRAYSKGRALVEFDTLGQIRLQDFVWSFNYLDNTKINGISTFESLNRVQLDEKNGQINAISVVGDVVKVIQDNKETSLYIGKARFVDGDGTIGLVKSNDFIGDAYPSVSDYGSRYPNSVSTNNRDVYYFDGDRGQVIRSSANGQFPISDYGMKSEFLRIKRDMDNALGVDSRSVKVISFYDVRNDEYVITFDIRGNVETWAFKEGADQWVARYDFEDASGNAPSLYGNVGEQALSFLNGSVWLHERSTSYNTFYGDLKPLSVTGLLNIYPEQEKCLRAVKIDSNRAMDTTITSPVANTRPVGQKSLLYAESYSLREGSYTSAVYGNILGAGGVENLSLLHSGDDMVGKYLQLTFLDESASEMQLRLVTASFTINR